MKHPTWQDLQQLGCSKIGVVIQASPDVLQPTCSECGQDYYWSRATDEWVHPFEKEFDAFREAQAKAQIDAAVDEVLGELGLQAVPDPRVTLGKSQDGKRFIITHFSRDTPPFWRLDFDGEKHMFVSEQECYEFLHQYHEVRGLNG